MPQFVYVYILRSLTISDSYYLGLTVDLRRRLREHNSGAVSYTSDHGPWEIKTAIAFTDPSRARAFEKYLKTASGRAFSKKHL